MDDLTKLPVDTVIKSEEHGIFMKDKTKVGDFVWLEVFPHCGDCSVLVKESGSDETSTYGPHPSTKEKAQDYFGGYMVLALGIPEKKEASIWAWFLRNS